jgi:hypothetical protein
VKAPKKDPNTKSQAPVKLQKPIFKCCTRGLSTFYKPGDFTEAFFARTECASCFKSSRSYYDSAPIWCLRFGVSLVGWSLEFGAFYSA